MKTKDPESNLPPLPQQADLTSEGNRFVRVENDQAVRTVKIDTPHGEGSVSEAVTDHFAAGGESTITVQLDSAPDGESDNVTEKSNLGNAKAAFAEAGYNVSVVGSNPKALRIEVTRSESTEEKSPSKE